MKSLRVLTLFATILLPIVAAAQATNPLWHEEKIKNYLPHMSWPEVQDLLTRTDMVIIPVASLEQHALHLPEFGQIVEHLRHNVRGGDLVVTMGAGNVWEVGRDLLS